MLNSNKPLDLAALRRAKMGKGLEKCPSGCVPGLRSFAMPGPGKPGNAVARCLQCLVYWEVTPGGDVLVLRRGLDTLLGATLPQGDLPVPDASTEDR